MFKQRACVVVLSGIGFGLLAAALAEVLLIVAAGPIPVDWMTLAPALALAAAAFAVAAIVGRYNPSDSDGS